MRNVMLVSLVGVLLVVGLAGCGTIIAGGPFVTDIAYDGEGNLMITKNTLMYNYWFADFSNGANPQTIVIKTPKNK